MAAVARSRSGDRGGLYLRNLSDGSILTGNLFERNRGCDSCLGHSEGIYVAASETTIQNNECSRNTATWAGPHGEGGSLYVDAGTVVIRGNLIAATTGAYFSGFPSTATGYGGGAAAVGGHTTLRDNSITANGGTNGEGLGAGGEIFGDSATWQIEDNTIALPLVVRGAGIT
jgi:hypothetical protein